MVLVSASLRVSALSWSTGSFQRFASDVLAEFGGRGHVHVILDEEAQGQEEMLLMELSQLARSTRLQFQAGPVSASSPEYELMGRGELTVHAGLDQVVRSELGRHLNRDVWILPENLLSLLRGKDPDSGTFLRLDSSVFIYTYGEEDAGVVIHEAYGIKVRM